MPKGPFEFIRFISMESAPLFSSRHFASPTPPLMTSALDIIGRAQNGAYPPSRPRKFARGGGRASGTTARHFAGDGDAHDGRIVASYFAPWGHFDL
jgi:hypothetical protein